MTPSLTGSGIDTALRAFLLAVSPAGTEAVKGFGNLVPMPKSASLVVFTPLNRQQMAQTVHDYAPDDDTQDVIRSTAFNYLLDVYGPAAADTAQVITTLLRDAWGCDFLASRGVAPLYTEDPSLMPLVTGEAQYVQRWMVRCALHANVAVTVPAEFADTVITTLESYK